MNNIRNDLKPVGFAQWRWKPIAPSLIVNSGTLSRNAVAVPFRVEDLLAKFQNQSFSAISKAGDVNVLESRLVVLVVVTEDQFATAFLDTFRLVALLFCKGRVPDSASVFQNRPNVSLKDGQYVLH